jgi:pimeloyl-ACP methyl ester carboxylesterase
MKIKTTKLVQFKSTDNLFLPGLLFEPKGKTKKVALNLHGNGSSSVFYSHERTIAFAEELNKKGISFFTFNNRGAHYIKKLKIDTKDKEDEIKLGTAFELIKDCVKDIDGAIKFLEQLGYKEFYLMGHSTGANKICVYNYYKPKNKFSKYVLLGGGDDTGIYHDLVGGPQKFKKYLKQAKKQIDKGNGRKFIPKYIVNYMFSYQAFYDTCNPDGDYNTFPFNEYINKLKLSKKPLFREYKSIKKPTLVIYGEEDEYCYGDVERIVEILKKETPNKKLFNFEIIKNADHGFTGYEKELARITAEWLVKK